MKVIILLRCIAILCTVFAVYTMKLINTHVPDAYMDEIFHYPMTQRYFNGTLSTFRW